MSVGWGIDVPGLLTSREVSEIAVKNDCGPAILADEGITVLVGERGCVMAQPVAVVDGEALYEARFVEWADQ